MSEAKATGTNQFLQNLVKLIPVEIIALFAVVKGLVPLSASPASVWVVFGILATIVPFYVVLAMNVKKWDQVILMTVAFPIWAIAIGGLPSLGLEVSWLEPWMLSVSLALFTLIPPMFYRKRIEVPEEVEPEEEIPEEVPMTASHREIKSWREVS